MPETLARLNEECEHLRAHSEALVKDIIRCTSAAKLELDPENQVDEEPWGLRKEAALEELDGIESRMTQVVGTLARVKDAIRASSPPKA